MLIEGYSAKLKILNNLNQIDNTNTPIKYTIPDTKLSITYYTTDLTYFDDDTIKEMKDEMEEQLSLARQMLDIQLEYQLITTSAYEITLKQYDIFFFVDSYAFLKEDIFRYLNQESVQEKIKLIRTPDTQHKQYGISRKEIRAITNYTFTPTPPHATSPQHILWQQQTLEDTSDRLVIDGSRQMGKSRVLAELLIEESFVPGADILVCAFLQSTTDVILGYMMTHTENFEEGIFVYKERKRYIVNTISKTRIHFRTLQDGAHNVRGLTIRLTVVDEAQLIPRDIIEASVEPTMTTTNGRMILIGTATEALDSMMYHIIECVETNSPEYNTPDTLSARHIKVSIDDNPFAHPKYKASIQARRNEPTVQREYYNRWGKLEGSLFNPRNTSIATLPQHIDPTQCYVILGIDPARKLDRSGYSVQLVYKTNIVTIESGFVPNEYKTLWQSQAQFYLKIQKNLRKQYPTYPLYTSFDATGVGDGVVTIFSQQGVTFSHLFKYTDGMNVSEKRDPSYPQAKTLTVGKPLLINNYLNISSTPTYHIIHEFNQALLDEIKYVSLSENARGQLGFTTKRTDDILNATLTSAFVINYERLQEKSTQYSTLTTSQQTFQSEISSLTSPIKNLPYYSNRTNYYNNQKQSNLF